MSFVHSKNVGWVGRYADVRRCKHPSPRLLVAAMIAAAFLGTASVAVGGPTILRDELVQDTSITPSLGRGYSVSTNTYQSMCLIDVVATTPSYDFDYEFREIAQDEVKRGAVATSKGSTGNASQGVWWSDFSRVTQQEWRTKTTETDRGGEKHYHMMSVKVNINVYYNAVDESKSKMSPAATKILESKDLPGFFDACGMYYVRSISRRGTVNALFIYSSSSSTRDIAFDDSLKSSIRQFSHWRHGANAVVASVDASKTGKMETKTSAKDLQILITAVGLGKSESTDLIAYDLETFRTTVKSAFKATQPQNVGRITSIEVVPWIENTEFQSLNRLEALTVPMFDAMGFPVYDTTDPNKKPPPQKTKVVLPYEQKRLLQTNGEFLSEVDRAARAKLNIYYKAKRCRATLNVDYMVQDDDGNWKFRPSSLGEAPGEDADEETKVQYEWLKTNNMGKTVAVWNNNRPGEWRYLDELDKLLNEDSLARIWMEYDSFMYGGTGEDNPDADKDPKVRASMARSIIMGTKPALGYPRNIFPGAGRCIADLFAAGITAQSYRTVKSCMRVEESFVTISGAQMDEYCPIRLNDQVKPAAQSLNATAAAPVGPPKTTTTGAEAARP